MQARRRPRSERATAAQRGYNARWRALRRMHLRRHPLCRNCLDRGRTTAADVVDHVVPHRGDPALLYDPDNLQSLCKACHDGAKQSEERTGRPRGCTPDGTPIDPGHHWKGEGGSNLCHPSEYRTGETGSCAQSRNESSDFLAESDTLTERAGSL